MFPWETYHEPEFQIQQNENHGLRINSFVTFSVERDVESVLKGTHGIWDNRSLRFPSSRAFFSKGGDAANNIYRLFEALLIVRD